MGRVFETLLQRSRNQETKIMKSFKLYDEREMTPEERKENIKSNLKKAAVLLFIAPWIVLAVVLIIIFIL